MVLDESSMIKAPKSQRSKAIRQLGKLAAYRRVADGTHVAESPFDIFNQLLFLDENYWRQYGLSSYFVFTTMFGIFVQKRAAAGHQYNDLVRYQNLDLLQQYIKNVSTRYLKEDCLDLPPKVYKKLTFELTARQRATYDALKSDYLTQLEEGCKIEAPLAIVRLMRLQQIASGYAVGEERLDVGGETPPATPEEALERIAKILDQPEAKRVTVELEPPESNPRLQLLLNYLETVHHKAIIFARFTKDLDIICSALGERALRYDGDVKIKDRVDALDRFRDPAGPQFLVVNIGTLSRGVTLVIAKTVIYYTNDFRLINRLQSEDRAHRIGQDEKVQYVDIVAEGTVDEHIVKTLRNKFDIAAMVTGDRLREWIQ
jgi:SNF2 family DNA or RNA helicase